MIVEARSIPADDRQLAREIRRARSLQQEVRQLPADEHADRGADDTAARPCKPALMKRHAARGDEVGREPGDEEHLSRVAAELSDRGGQDLPLPQQPPDVSST